MAKFEKRIEAHALRRSGKSIKNIAELLNVSKGTASIWCRDIELTSKQKEVLTRNQIKAGLKGRIIGAETNRKKKQENIKKQEAEAEKLVGKLTERDKLMLGIGLYWGDGVKVHNSATALVNSNPDILLFARDWFEQLGVLRSEFCPYIYISEAHRSREQVIRKFWSKHLSIPPEQFNKVTFLKGRPKKVYENHDSYYGVVALRVVRSASLKYKILGLIKASQKMSG